MTADWDYILTFEIEEKISSKWITSVQLWQMLNIVDDQRLSWRSVWVKLCNHVQGCPDWWSGAHILYQWCWVWLMWCPYKYLNESNGSFSLCDKFVRNKSISQFDIQTSVEKKLHVTVDRLTFMTAGFYILTIQSRPALFFDVVKQFTLTLLWQWIKCWDLAQATTTGGDKQHENSVYRAWNSKIIGIL